MHRPFAPKNYVDPAYHRSAYTLPTLRPKGLITGSWIPMAPALDQYRRRTLKIHLTQLRGGLHEVITRQRGHEHVSRLRFVSHRTGLWLKGPGWLHQARVICPSCGRSCKLLRWKDARWACDSCHEVSVSYQYKRRHEIKYGILERRIDRLNARLGNTGDPLKVPRKARQTKWSAYYELAPKLQQAIDDYEDLTDQWAAMPRSQQRFKKFHRDNRRTPPDDPPRYVKLIDAAAYFGIPATTIRKLATNLIRGSYSGLRDVGVRYVKAAHLRVVDFHKFAWWAEHRYRVEPIKGAVIPVELRYCMNPAYVSRSRLQELHPKIQKTIINHWVRNRQRFKLEGIIHKEGNGLFIHRENFDSWLKINGTWAISKARSERNGRMREYREALQLRGNPVLPQKSGGQTLNRYPLTGHYGRHLPRIPRAKQTG